MLNQHGETLEEAIERIWQNFVTFMEAQEASSNTSQHHIAA